MNGLRPYQWNARCRDSSEMKSARRKRSPSTRTHPHCPNPSLHLCVSSGGCCPLVRAHFSRQNFEDVKLFRNVEIVLLRPDQGGWSLVVGYRALWADRMEQTCTYPALMNRMIIVAINMSEVWTDLLKVTFGLMAFFPSRHKFSLFYATTEFSSAQVEFSSSAACLGEEEGEEEGEGEGGDGEEGEEGGDGERTMTLRSARRRHNFGLSRPGS